MADHDDLATTKTEGFKVGEKKTMEQYNDLGMDSLLNTLCFTMLLAMPFTRHQQITPTNIFTPI